MISLGDKDSTLDVGYLFRLLMMQSKLIIFITILGVAVGFTNYLLSDKIYRISSLLQVSSNQGSTFDRDLVDIYASSSTTQDLDNIKLLYKSRSHILKLIEDTKINITFSGDDKPNKNILKTFETNLLAEDFKIYLNENNFEIKLNGNSEIVQYGTFFNNEFFSIQLDKPLKTNYGFNMSYLDPQISYKITSASFKIENSLEQSRFTPQRGSGFVRVDYNTTDIEEGLKILNYSNQLFISEDIKLQSEEARKASYFIDQRINTIEEQLKLEKEQLQNFKEVNRTVDVNLEIESLLNSISVLNSKLNEIDVSIAKASTSYTDTNPLFLDLLNQKLELQKQRNELENKIDDLPFAQQKYVDLFRNVETTQEIYSELLSKKLEFSIREASTLGNIRIVDEAYLENQISPTLSIIVLYSIFAFILSIAIALFRGIFFIPITNPAELYDANIDVPILGVCPFIETDHAEWEEKDERLRSSIESMIVNILSSSNAEGNTTILLTSPTAENGKSFLSRSLASGFAEIGKKVMLIDADWKRGDQHKQFNVDKITLEEFEQFNPQNPEEFKIKENLYLIPKITKLSNSFQFINSLRFETKMNEIKECFDIVIIDTAPGLSVSDTQILMSFTDTKLCVVKHGHTKMNEIKQLIQVVGQIGVNFDGLLYNGYSRPSSYYGYYGLYGNYSYQYYAKKYLYDSYDYEKE